MGIKNYEEIINELLEYDIDFIEIFYQDKKLKRYIYENERLNNINFDIIKGIGIRTVMKEEEKYFHTNILDKDSINALVNKIKNSYKKSKVARSVKLVNENIESQKVLISHDKFGEENKKEYLKNADMYARSLDKRISQFRAIFREEINNVVIANSDGKYASENRVLTRVMFNVFAKENDKNADAGNSAGGSKGYEILEEFDYKKVIKEIVDIAIKKLNAVSFKGGKMPVIIDSGSGAVIFHEACGHALEATTVAKGTSVLTGKLGQKIASEKVTLIDDGTIPGAFGTTVIDDEGNKTRKNVLIEKGILKGYLIHGLGSKKMNMPITGSGRRENYSLLPTSRMNNTYLLPGNDKFEDMIKDIKYGLYVKKIGGGSVVPVTGDFNFAATEAYLIENGKIGNIVKKASLIGNTLEILNNVVMVGKNIEFDTGMCGSVSGHVPVTVGQPIIKVSSILVGGDK